MKKFKCIECGKSYLESDIPTDGICHDINCPGQSLTGLIIPDESENENSSSNNNGIDSGQGKEVGLCVLLMDASGSMAEEPYPTCFPSKYPAKIESQAYTEREGKLTKREVVTDAAALAIFGLRNLSKKENAYICAIKFDNNPVVMFTKTVAEIIEEYQDPKVFAEYLYKELSSLNGGTNINGALNLAYNFVKKFIEGTVPGMENCIANVQTQWVGTKAIDIPNVRIMLYTDGEQLQHYGDIINPFKANNDELDLLIGAYIGNPTDSGCKQLEHIVSNCPIHNQKQFYVMDTPQKIATLRGLFRMASGASGFCPYCIEK
ncbi:VWA domain-containing protein [Bacteroidales bacterium OttesenSCG-928-B11]|nr:VWA domain-containing protein [Bacteroidales bacterium OttesenSCG-928-B11]